MTVPADDSAWLVRPASRREDGAGHVARCLALASALDGPVRFLLDPESPWAGRIEAAGFGCDEEDHPAGTTQSLRALAEPRARGLILDGYDFAPVDAAALARAGFLVRILDDGEPGDARAVINPNPGAESMVCRPAPALVLAGPRYALLDARFQAAGRPDRNRGAAGEDRLRHLLVSMGGRDSRNATGLALDAIEAMKTRASVDILLPWTADHIDAVTARIANLPRATLHVDVENPVPFLDAADLAVGAGGVSLAERMCRGLPAVIVALAPNQAGPARAAADAGAVCYAGEIQALAARTLAATIDRLLADRGTLARMRDAGRRLVDGRGAVRAARALETARRETAA